MPTRARKQREWCFFNNGDVLGAVRRHRGRIVRTKEGEIRLFPTSALAKMLCRSPQAIYAWEKKRGFPRPPWRVPDGAGKWSKQRLYSVQQLVAIQHLYEHYGRLRGEHRASLTAFITATSMAFAVLEKHPLAPCGEVIELVHIARHLAGSDGYDTHRSGWWDSMS